MPVTAHDQVHVVGGEVQLEAGVGARPVASWLWTVQVPLKARLFGGRLDGAL